MHADYCTSFELWNADTDTKLDYAISSGDQLCRQRYSFTIEANVSECIAASEVYTEVKYAKLTMAAPTTDTKHFESRVPLTFFGDNDTDKSDIDVTGIEMMLGEYSIASKSFAINFNTGVQEVLENYVASFEVIDCDCGEEECPITPTP